MMTDRTAQQPLRMARPERSSQPSSTTKLWGFGLVALCALALAGCASFGGETTASTSRGGGDGIDDSRLGVAASPLVATRNSDIPRGGGRDQIGRPYTIAGVTYRPHADPDYDRTGMASWYGPGFHGRLTANGEVYDQYALSAAHPTLPLPSYVRVTNLSNDHSVVVRVNDRGPFSNNRIIDLSQRAADVLDMRNQGVARVRVEYMDRAPLHGQDVEWLEASIRVPGRRITNDSVVLAQAPVVAPTPAPATPQRPVRPVGPTPTIANALVSSPILASTQAQGAPLSLAPPSRTPTFAPAAPGTVPGAPIPSATIGFRALETAETVTRAVPLAAGFVQRNRDTHAQQARIDGAHARAATQALDAANALALQSEVMRYASSAQVQAPSLEAAAPATVSSAALATIQIGIFGDPANVARLRNALDDQGRVVTETLQRGGRTLTQVTLEVPVAGDAEAQRVLQSLARQGYTDAYLSGLDGA
ncbi:MAG: septal ring lytic transglycosylase RlpA family protein [Devosiaceae bacterium]|nr:septal ring lytic transglycosylase RlpA family protein [Devosiaceae bacterium MH13]